MGPLTVGPDTSPVTDRNVATHAVIAIGGIQALSAASTAATDEPGDGDPAS